MSTILIVDDVEESRYLLTSLLEGHGYDVDAAANGVDALALARARAVPPDLVLSDLMMPMMDGFELCRRWKSDPGLSRIPFVVYTATYTGEKDERLALELGADRFLTKPMENERLIQVIREVLGQALRDPGSVHLPPPGRALALLQDHNDALLRKLQKKVAELEAASAGRIRVADEARQANAFLDSIIENIPNMLFLKDARELRFCRLNRAGEDLLGFSRADLLGKNDYDLFPTEQADDFTQHDRQVLAGGTAVDISQEPVQTRHNGERILHTKKVPILNAGGVAEYLLGISEDITDRQQAEEQRQTLQTQLQASQKLEAIGRLAGGVAHDFNNLLSVILGYASFAIDAVRPGDPLRADLEEVRRAGERAAGLTRQLLAFSRNQLLAPEVLNLNSIVNGIENMLRRLLGEDVAIEVRLADDLANVVADPGQIEQVLMNLAVNARDAMPHGGTLTISTANVEVDGDCVRQHAGAKPGPFVRLSVADSGVGMDAATRERIFEPFFSTKEMGKGTGLGLSTVYGIVKQSDGNIWVTSEPGCGTTFDVYLPRVAVAAAGPRLRPVAAATTGSEMVLVVEDEELVRGIVERVLKSSGYRVLVAANGGEALLLCEKHGDDIDLLLTDVVMPQMSGQELVERIASISPGLKTLFMSGYTDNAIIHDGILSPGTQLLSKPFSAPDLTRKVREVLDSR